MMQVSNASSAGNAVQPVKEQANAVPDTVSKEIQGRIMDAQKRRQDLSSDTNMTAQEKESKRQKIQQEISDLKRELRQRQAEEKKKQQEERKAEQVKEEQKKHAYRENIKEQQTSKQAQEADGRQREEAAGPDSSRQADANTAEAEGQEALTGVMHNSMSKDAAFEQMQIVRNTAAQAEGTVRIREAEINQDAARGVDVEARRQEHLESIKKDARRMERMQAFMFEGTGRTADAAEGAVKQVSGSPRGKGLYNNIGMMFKTNFQSVQMDMRQ